MMKPSYHKMPDGSMMKDSEMKTYEGKSMRLGGGGQFAKLEDALANKPGIEDPSALAAAIGRKKYGKEKFQGMAATGLRRALEGNR